MRTTVMAILVSVLASLANAAEPQERVWREDVTDVSVPSIPAQGRVHGVESRVDSARLAAASWASPDIDVHLRALKSEYRGKRWAAATALGRLGDKRAVEPLIEALKDPDSMVRASAANALGLIGDPRALDALKTAATADSDHFVRLQASQAGARIRENESGERSEPSRKDEAARRMRDGRTSVPSGFDFGLRATPPGAVSIPDATRSQSPGPRRQTDIHIIYEHLRALKSKHRVLRMSAASTLGHLRERLAVEPLIEALKDPDSTVRASAANALGLIGDPRALDSLTTAATTDSDRFVRLRASQAGVRIREKESAERSEPSRKDHVARRMHDSRTSAPSAFAPGSRTTPKEAAESIPDATDPKGLLLAWQRARGEGGPEANARIADAMVEMGEPIVAPLLAWANRGSAEVFGAYQAGRLARMRRGSMDQPLRDFEAAILVRIGPPAVQPLIDELKNPNSKIRPFAAMVLGRLGDERALDPLVQAMKEGATAFLPISLETRDPVRTEAFFRAQERKEFRSRVSRLLERDGPRTEAKKALARMGSPAVEPLIALLTDSNEWVRLDAVETLGLIGDRRAVAPLHQTLNQMVDDDDVPFATIVVTSLQRLGEPVVEPLTRALEHEEATTRCFAARTLGEIRDKRAVPALIAAIKDPDWSTKLCAIEALGLMGDRRAVAPLIEALPHTLDGGGATGPIALALANLRDPRAVQPLIDALRHIHTRTWYSYGLGQPEIVKALGRLGDPRAVPPLIEAINRGYFCKGQFETLINGKRHKYDYDVFEALAELNDVSAVEPLIDFMFREKPLSRAGGTLVKLGDKRAVRAVFEAHAQGKLATEVLAELLVEMGDAAATQKALAETGHDRVVEQLIDLLPDDSPYAPSMSMLLETFRRYQPDSSHLPRRRDRRASKQEYAAEALGLLGDERALEALIRHAPKNDKAIEALGRLGDRRAVDVLIGLLPHRTAAAEALSELGDRRAVAPLVAAMREEGVLVRCAAVRALEKLGWEPQGQEEEVLYRIAKQQWDECVRIGPPAVEMLISVDWSNGLGCSGGWRDSDGTFIPFPQENEDVWKGAIKALGQIGDRRATDRLLRALEWNKNPEIRITAIEAIRKLADQQAVPWLVPLLRHWRLNTPAAAALRDLGWEPHSLRDRVYLHVANRDGSSLAAEWPAAKEVLLSDLRDARLEFAVRKNAGYALIAMGREESVRILAFEMTRLVPSVTSEKEELIETLLKCGNQVLAQAGRVWALESRYDVESRKGKRVVTWGEWSG